MSTSRWFLLLGYGWLLNAAILHTITHLPEPRRYELTKRIDDALAYLMPIPGLPAVIIVVVVMALMLLTIIGYLALYLLWVFKPAWRQEIRELMKAEEE